MAEPAPPRAKKVKRSTPISRVSAEERAKQFKDDLYADSGVLFCRYCEHSVDFSRVDTIKDHLRSKKHGARKTSKGASSASAGPSTSRQVTLTSIVKSKDLREEFVLHYVKLCTLADIPGARKTPREHKTEKMRPFMQKYCKQAGTLPQVSPLHKVYVPRLFEKHYSALAEVFKSQPVSITVDETTDVRDHSILNVIANVRGKPYLIEVVQMEACNHSTFSQAIIWSVTDIGITFEQITAVVSDSAAYCKKAYRDVLSAVFPNSVHVLCLAHIVNLVAEVFRHHRDFSHTCDLVTMIKSSLLKKPGRKSRFLKFHGEFISSADVKLPPVPVSTRWNSWFAAVIYHATRVQLYEGFYKAESSKGMAVEWIIELVTHRELYPEICLQLHFIKENCQRIMSVLTSLESKETPLACTVYNLLEDLRTYLKTSSMKTSFGIETDRLLAKLPVQEKRKKIKSFQEVFSLSLRKLESHLDSLQEKRKKIKSFQEVFSLSLRKLESHLDSHPVYSYYKAARLFDPRQLPIITHDIGDYCAIKAFENPSPVLLEEFLIYCQSPIDSLPNPLVLSGFWDSMQDRLLNLSSIARDAMWMPVSSVDVERSFSQYKHLLNDRREVLTEENTKRLLMLYYNGDIEGQFS